MSRKLSTLLECQNVFQEELVRWLAEEMSHQGMDIDQLDLGANSPLHLAAKEGHTSSVAALLHFGATVGLKVSKVACAFTANQLNHYMSKRAD